MPPFPSQLATFLTTLVLAIGCGGARPSEQSQELREGTKPKPKVVKESSPDPSAADVPAWATDAIFYQIFPERFANGDPKNDPTGDSTEFPDVVGDNWHITPWTGDWYARADWEVALGDNFFDDGVFHRRYGGDIQGILNKLDYLKHLGVNTLYLNPVFYAKSLHKYDGNTYHHIDPYFGPAPTGRPEADGHGDQRSKNLALDSGRQVVSQAGRRSSRPRDADHHRRRVQSHRPRFLRLR